MDAIEFITTIKDGKIEIPTRYQKQGKERVRVILFFEQEKKIASTFIDDLLDKPIKVKGFHPLKRDDIYE